MTVTLMLLRNSSFIFTYVKFVCIYETLNCFDFVT
jgi:hypothetical protein